MQLTHRSNRILQPARTWFIHFSLLVALTLNYIPTGRLTGVPDSTASHSKIVPSGRRMCRYAPNDSDER